MLKYLVILLDDTSTSFCHYEVKARKPRLITHNDLSSAITFGMKENLRIQFVYPDYAIPNEYESLINNIDHIKIKSGVTAGKDDIAIAEISDLNVILKSSNIVLRASFKEFSNELGKIIFLLFEKERLNIILKDIGELSDCDIKLYKRCLNQLVVKILEAVKNGYKLPQINIITDRLALTSMNNCNAGTETITVAANGRFYICPAFYYGGKNDCGSLSEGLLIKNQQLYQLEYAPICRNCDAWHCHRCIWLNSEKTLEVNTPSHIQCVISHLERNASRELLLGMRKLGELMPKIEIPEISYLDPFENKQL